MLIGEKICAQEYKKESRTQKVLRLIRDLEKNFDQFDIDQFKTQAVTSRSHLAIVIDMDL
jgi:hypothetical protein